jgi:putative ABC transport system substrate-binding protein
MKRREFITLLGGAAAWPLAARAQQRALPAIGYLSGRTADSEASMMVALRRGLADVGYAEGRNVAIEYRLYRFTDGRYDRLSGQLTDLTQRKVGVIVLAVFSVFNDDLSQQVRASPIPIVIIDDPVGWGLVASMNRPGGT